MTERSEADRSARAEPGNRRARTDPPREIRSFNVIAVAVIALGNGIIMSVVSLIRSDAGIDPFAVTGGIGLGAGLPLLWLGLRRDRRTPATARACIALAVVLCPVFVLGLSVL